MKEVEELRRLVNEALVRQDLLARLCQCSPASIQNYIHGTSLPSGSRMIAIKEGLRKYKEMINQIIEE